MKSMGFGVILCALFGLLPLARAQAVSPQEASLDLGRATIAAVKGDVAIRAANGSTLPSVRGQVLPAGTVVEIKKGSLVLDFADGSQAQLKGNTRVVLKDPAKEKYLSLELLVGKILTKIKKRLGMEPSFRMGTPTAVITVRGTEFMTEVGKQGKTEVYVYEGVVEVAGLLPGSRSVFVRPGFWTEVEPHRPPRPPTPIDRSQGITRASDDADIRGTPSSADQTQTESGERQRSSESESEQREKPDD